ncbi:IclR family transcriptional regulator [Modestobacter versicolor]|uniref:Glycerol operon regulatory protein n=1 Tax=Modestobacter versicolor TaxID=429133 RepID=A0A323VDW4_9ACTN|nr:IclR family transcriptional regulator [Modestobacter versicolor]MBB3677411.1 DNA-binding IclR family transcriptional regulator [Modestobacter versicolor]PZA22233.1 IclR family transcriptional regulator [Modestobacter versicolor]
MPGSVQSIERAAAILQVVAGSGGTLGVTDIAEAVGLAKTTTHSLLRTLLLVGFVEQDRATGRYALGSGLLRLGSHLDVNELRARASNWADALAARSGHAVRLATLTGEEVVVVHHVFRPDDSAQTLDVGTALSPASALGKVLFAHSHPHTGHRSGHRPTLAAAELAEVRARGWATARGEVEPGMAGIAAPVRGAGGLVVAALGISGPQSALLDPKGVPRSLVLAMVTDAAHAVSRELGHGGG